jgi:tartrate-resistant acid phosphatase type 5
MLSINHNNMKSMNRSGKPAVFSASIAILCLAIVACRVLTTPTPNVETVPQPTSMATGVLSTFTAPAAASQPKLPESTKPIPTETPIPTTPTATQVETARFAVIGDYGEGNQGEQDVADMITGWKPDFIITTGDNNYPSGSAETIDYNIGKGYHSFIYPYMGGFGEGANRLRFFPSLGNHDLNSLDGQPYYDYFELPGNERYYDFNWGPVYFLALNSDSREQDGISRGSNQAKWAKARLEASAAPWKVVYFHAPPYSSGPHGSSEWMRWPFSEWGASVVLAGHNHIYERLSVDGFPYFVNGIGGGPIYSFDTVSEFSQFRYNDDYGAMLVTVDPSRMLFEFFNRTGMLIDRYQLNQE